MSWKFEQSVELPSEPIELDEDINRGAVPALKVHPDVLGANADDLFAAGVADMDFRVAPAIRESLKKRLEHGVFGYETIPDGLIPSLTNWLRVRQGWQVEESHVLRSPDVLSALAVAARLFTGKGDGVIVQPPVFFNFFDLIRKNDRRLILNPLILDDAGYRMDFDDLERKASDPRTRMIFLCSPHNPVGRVWNKEELKTLGDICLRHDVLVVSDEVFADIILDDREHTPFASLGGKYADISITCVSPEKSFNIAACCSAFTIISNDDKRRLFDIENGRLTLNKNNAFVNVAMEAAYRCASSWLDEVLSYLDRNIALAADYVEDMPGVELIKPEGTFLLWFDFRQLNLTDGELTTFLEQKAKWAVTHGTAFGPEGAGFARVNIACPRTRLDAALQQLSLAIKSASA